MFLTLEVISPNGEALGANRRRTVGPEGVQIGRSKENDWVIKDPYLSRVNARIRCVNGAFYIEGLGRVPLAVNDAANVVANNEPLLLRSGDRFFLDQYEIRATIAKTSAGRAPAPVLDDPFSLAEPTSRVVPGEWAEGTDRLDLDIRDSESAGDVNLDPIEALGGSAPKAAAPKQIDLDQGSVLDDHYEAPRPQPARADPVVGPIPDAWDRSRLTAVEAGKPTPRRDARPRPAKGMSPAADIPDAWDRTNKPSGQRPPASSNVAARTVRQAGEGAVGTEVLGSAGPVGNGRRGNVSSTISLEALLQAAGVPATRMSPELAAELGAVFRIVVQGLMEVLQSRAEIKSELRMSMTRMQSTENNPLKFSPNVEAALHTLLVDRNRGYLPTKRAFEEALLDIRNHQIAVLQGIRVAFDAMLEHFEPERLAAELERSSKRGGLLSGGGKSRFHDRYVEQFKKLTKDRDESFRRLFGEHFAQAYEEQMVRLKEAARTSGGSTAQAKNREPDELGLQQLDRGGSVDGRCSDSRKI